MKKILAFGEILWDMLPTGKQIGGAPGNFAYHALNLAADARTLSRVGRDTLGDEVFATFKQRGVPTEFIGVDNERATGTVEVTLLDGQPSYKIVENVAWDRITPDKAAMEFAKNTDLLCFGSLACRSEENRAALDHILAVVPKSALVIFDLNLRKPFYSKATVESLLAKCNVFKLNDDELIELAGMFGEKMPLGPFLIGEGPSTSPADEWLVFIAKLIAEYDLRYLILTCGAKGSFLFDSCGNESFAPATPTDVVSTVGAGDAFTAVCAIGFLTGKSLDAINAFASRYAAFVCSKPGGMPEIPDHLIFQN